MHSEKILSVITVTKNDAQRLRKTLQSISTQNDFSECEYIVIDGASIDETHQLTQEYLSQIDLFVSEPDRGLYDAMNKGARVAKGRYLLFLNAGDELYEPQTTQNIVEKLRSESSHVIYGDALVSRDGFEYILKSLPIEQLEKRMVTSHQAVIALRNLVLRHPFNLKWKIAADYEQLLQAHKNKESFEHWAMIISRIEAGGISDQRAFLTLWEQSKISTQIFSHLLLSPLFWLDRATQFLQSCLKLLPHFIRNKLYRIKFKNEIYKSKTSAQLPLNLGIVVPSYQTSSRQIQRLVDSVFSQAQPYDKIKMVIVHSGVSNHSEKLEFENANIQSLWIHERLFPGAARNLGASYLQDKDILIFLDSDCLWNYEWLETARQYIAKNKFWDILNGPVHFEDIQNRWAMALHFVEFHEFTSPRLLSHRFPHSGNLVIRRKAFEKIGGFRSDWQYCEDIGMFSKPRIKSEAKPLNLKLKYLPKLSITHTAHMIEKDEILKKAKIHGAWRAYINHELSPSVKKPIQFLRLLPGSIIANIFLALILFRCLKNGTIYYREVFKYWSEIRLVIKNWAVGFKENISTDEIKRAA